MFILTTAITALALGAFFDGLTTNSAIKRGAHEANPAMVWLFGTARPSAATVYLRGGVVIAAESGIALTFSHFAPHVGIGIAVALLAQTAIHFFEVFHNLKQAI
jgi:hypothetical protein